MTAIYIQMKPRKRHVQQALAFKTWGGKREGAGRPAKGSRSSERHKRRPEHCARHPVHVTLRVERAVGTLRRRDAYHAVRKAMYTTLGRTDFRIVHLSLEDDHLHLLVEADHKLALSRGMQGFEIAAARRLNAAVSKARGVRRSGRVFVDRYHARALTSPRDTRHTLSYVLNNWRRHQQDRGLESMFWEVDYYSSGVSFGGWKELAGSPFLPAVPEGYERLSVSRPKTWLLERGWMRSGSISMRAVPGRAPAAR